MTHNYFLNKKVNWKILVLFINNPSKLYSFSDLVCLTKSGPTNVKKAINELKDRNFFISKKRGNKILYQINLDNYSVRSLFLTYAWDKVNNFPEKVKKCLKILLEKFIPKEVISIYLFGSSVYKTKPNDFDLAVIYNQEKKELNKIWLETIKDFEENIEIHFFQKEEFIKFYREGNYRITSMLEPCLVLYDQNFIFNYLKNIPLPTKKFLLNQIKDLEKKLEKGFKLYRKRKKDCEELINNIFNDFLRVYISYKQKIPGSKHVLDKQAKKLGLDIKRRDLWERLEWMEKIVRKIKISI